MGRQDGEVDEIHFTIMIQVRFEPLPESVRWYQYAINGKVNEIDSCHRNSSRP